MDIYQVTVACLVFFITIQTGCAIDCWVCTSGDSGCGETIDDLTLQSQFKTASGCAGCGKSFKALGTIFYSVERTCLTSASDTCDNKLGYGYCSCSTTFCNGQGHVTISPALIILTSLCAAYIRRQI